ncbi:MAG: BadF/BadG/BcrA/BcrD ATPase family protein [Pseudomonadota bacterium]
MSAARDRYLAVDGGGSGCRMAIWTGTQRVEVSAGPANVTTDLQAALANIRCGLKALGEQAGVEGIDDVPGYLGLAGVTGPEIAKAVAEGLPLKKVRVEEDRPAAVEGALDGRDGWVVSVGTGSFVACRRAGQMTSIGGWGAELGDEASGAWLGRRALALALHTWDGLVPETAWLGALLDRLNGPEGIVALARDAAPQDLAALAPVVLEAAEQRAPLACALLDEGGAYLLRCLRVLGWSGDDPVCVAGGLGPVYADKIPDIPWTQPLGTPLDGALRLAREFAP